jgi:hypothetical protein
MQADENRTIFSSTVLADFRRQQTKKRLFSSNLFRRPNFVGWPMKIAIFDGIGPIFVGFWPTKISYFPVVTGRRICNFPIGLCKKH